MAATLHFYESNAEEYVKATVGFDLGDLHSVFTSHLTNRSHILDAGCGSGRDGAFFLKHGYKVTAIDASPAMVSSAQALGVRAKLMKFQDMVYEAEFDGIWACASLLHVPHAEIGGVLRRFEHALKPGGLLLVTLKEGRGEGISNDGRFFAYYELDELLEILNGGQAWSDLDARRVLDDRGQAWLNFLARKQMLRTHRPASQATGCPPFRGFPKAFAPHLYSRV